MGGLLDPEAWAEAGRRAKGLLAEKYEEAKGILGHPRAVYEGKADPYDPGMALGMAGMAMTGGFGGAPKGAIGSGPIFNRTGLDKVPDVPQFDLPRYTPPRGVPDRIAELTSDPKVREQMLDVIRQGMEKKGHHWYNAEPLLKEFVDELGPDEGMKAFRKYMDFVAATSPRSDVGTNVRNASYYYNLWKNDQPMPEVGTRNPAPYGHLAQKNHQMNAQAVAGEGWDPLKNPKPASFVENLVGNQSPATIDTHAFRLPALLKQDPRFLETSFKEGKDVAPQNIKGLLESGQITMDEALKRPAWWQSQPSKTEYKAMEDYYKGLGEELGITPAQTQAAAWVGGGKTTGLASDSSKPFIGFFEDRLKVTAEKNGLSEREVLKKFIRGEMPLLGIGTVAAIPALAGLAQEELDRRESR
jgi:hypothetical protein